MTTIDTTPPGELAGATPGAATPPVDNYLTWSKGVASWAFTLDHKRIGVMYLLGVLLSFLVGGIFALIIRTELIAPGQTIIEPETYNIFFTLHGAVMVFLVIIPSIPGSLGNFVLPIMLGAKDVAFPRLNLLQLPTSGSSVRSAPCWLSLTVRWFRHRVDVLHAVFDDDRLLGGVVPVVTSGCSSSASVRSSRVLNFVVTVHKLRPPRA